MVYRKLTKNNNHYDHYFGGEKIPMKRYSNLLEVMSNEWVMVLRSKYRLWMWNHYIFKTG